MTASSAILRLIATGVMLPLITSLPVSPNHTWTDPCNGLSGTPPSTVSMLDMMKQLTADAQAVYQRAEELVNFYTTVQKDESQPRVTDSYVKKLQDEKLQNFPYNNTYDNSDNLTLGLLNDYMQLSRVAIYCQDAIRSDKMFALTNNAQSRIASLMSNVTAMLCRLDLTLRKSNFTNTNFEESDKVLGSDDKTIPNDYHELYEYIIFRDTQKYASVLHNKYSNISKGRTFKELISRSL